MGRGVQLSGHCLRTAHSRCFSLAFFSHPCRYVSFSLALYHWCRRPRTFSLPRCTQRRRRYVAWRLLARPPNVRNCQKAPYVLMTVSTLSSAFTVTFSYLYLCCTGSLFNLLFCTCTLFTLYIITYTNEFTDGIAPKYPVVS